MKKLVSVLLVSAMTILMAMPVMAEDQTVNSETGSAEVTVKTDTDGPGSLNKYVVVLPATVTLATDNGTAYSQTFNINVKGRLEQDKYVELSVGKTAGSNDGKFTLTGNDTASTTVEGTVTLDGGAIWARSDATGISGSHNNLNVEKTGNLVAANITKDADYTGQLYFTFALKP